MSTVRFQNLGKLLFSGLLCLSEPRLTAATDPYLLLSAPAVTNGQLQFTLQAESGVSYVIEVSPDLQNWSPVTTNSDFGLTRLITLDAATNPAFVRVWRQPLPVFAAALAARLSVNLQGNSIHFDSYDSSDTNYSSNGDYDPLKAKAGGDIASGLGLLNVGNANINGRIKTGPAGSFALGPDGYVGPIGWFGPGLFSPDWYRNDYRFAFSDKTVANIFGTTPYGFGTNYWVLFSENYLWSGNATIPINTNILVLGNAALYVTGEFRMFGSSKIIIPYGSSLRLYSGGARTTFRTIQNPPDAATFQYYGLTGVTSVTWSGGTNFTGVIYAPQATLSIGGGGPDTYQFKGAGVVDQAELNGHFEFHFDENLMRKGPVR